MAKEKKDFETVLKRLEEIVGKLEGGGLSLEESLILYEEGIKKAESLETMLSEARGKVMKLVGGKDGAPGLDLFEEVE